MDKQWPDVEQQMAAQKAGLLIAITREFKPQEAELMKTKGFAPVYKFTNPRTGNVGVLWIKDFTGGGGPVTKLPEFIRGTEPDPVPPTYDGGLNSLLSEMERPRVMLRATPSPLPSAAIDQVCSPEYPCSVCESIDGGGPF